MYIDVAYSVHSVIRTPYCSADTIVDAIDLHKVRISACLQPHPGTSLSATPESLTLESFEFSVIVLKRRDEVKTLPFVYKNEISGVEVAQHQNRIKLAEDNFGKSCEDQGCRSSACQPRDITIYGTTYGENMG